MHKKSLRIATRKSPLALWQAHYVKKQLEALYPEINISLVTIVTKADKLTSLPLTKIGGKGLFIKALEEAMLSGDADLCVHSLKDMPSELPEGLSIAAICKRATPYDAFVSNKASTLAELPQGALIGTSSLRRQCQLKHVRADLTFDFLRGNVGTRLAKLDNGDYDAIILAAAGLERLQKAERINEQFTAEIMLPAVAQGAIAIECRSDSKEISALLAPLNDEATHHCVTAERTMNLHLGGSCHSPIAGFATLADGKCTLKGCVVSLDGKTKITASHTDSTNNTVKIGEKVAMKLLAQGAEGIIHSTKG